MDTGAPGAAGIRKPGAGRSLVRLAAYVEARAIRQSASTGNMVHLEGDGGARGGGSFYLIVRHRAGGADTNLASAAHTGRILAGGRAPTVKEGRWPDGQLSVIEFDDRAAATAWCESEGIRQMGGEAVLVEGA